MSQYFLNNLDEWVKMQKKMLDTFKEMNKDVTSKGDRLELVLASRAAFQHMIKTLKAFDQWLQDPVILSNLTRENLLEVWESAYKMLLELLELDVRHTSAFRAKAEEMIKTGKVDPLFMLKVGQQGEEGERGRRQTPPITM